MCKHLQKRGISFHCGVGVQVKGVTGKVDTFIAITITPMFMEVLLRLQSKKVLLFEHGYDKVES